MLSARRDCNLLTYYLQYHLPTICSITGNLLTYCLPCPHLLPAIIPAMPAISSPTTRDWTVSVFTSGSGSSNWWSRTLKKSLNRLRGAPTNSRSCSRTSTVCDVSLSHFCRASCLFAVLLSVALLLYRALCNWKWLGEYLAPRSPQRRRRSPQRTLSKWFTKLCINKLILIYMSVITTSGIAAANS